MFKNLTTKQVALYLTALITFFAVIFIITIVFLFNNESSLITLAILIALFSFICYFSISYLLERFVFRKINLIYKIISKKQVTDQENVLMEGNFDKVNTQVARWAADTEREIKDLKDLEDYRRNFVGNLSHELKTPIFAIQGYLHTLLDGALYDEKINKKYIKKAANNAERLQDIVDDLDTIHQLESGNVVLMLSTFDIKDLVLEVFGDLKFVAEKKNIELLFKEGESPSVTVMADKQRIRSVLSNLIMNSIKYNDVNGSTMVSFNTLNDKILVEISDNGIGINERHLNHLFDRFYRVDESRSRDQGGSGLGLAIVKHIVESHGQNINVRSTEGVGSSFGFTLAKASQ